MISNINHLEFNDQNQTAFFIDKKGKFIHLTAKEQLNIRQKYFEKFTNLFKLTRYVKTEATSQNGDKKFVYLNLNTLSKRMGIPKKELLSHQENVDTNLLKTPPKQAQATASPLVNKMVEFINSEENYLSEEEKTQILATVKFISENQKEVLKFSKKTGADFFLRKKDFFNSIPMTIQVFNQSFLIHTHSQIGEGATKIVKKAVLIEGNQIKLVANSKILIGQKSEKSDWTHPQERLDEVEKELKINELFKDSKYVGILLYHQSNYKRTKKDVSKHKFQLVSDLYVRGDLEHLDKTKLTFKNKKTIGTRLLEGLKEIHNKGMVHFDIKPANVLLEKNLTPHIIDFGSMSANQSLQNLKFPPPTTPELEAPEMGKSWKNAKKELSTAYDIWCMGVTLYMLFKNVNLSDLYDPKTRKIIDQELLKYHQAKQPEPQNKYSIDHLLWQMLQVNPTKRITAQEALEAALKLQE